MANIMTLAPMLAKRAQQNTRLSVETLHIHANESMHLPSKISKPFDTKAQKMFKMGPATISQNNRVATKSFSTKAQTKINTFFTGHMTM